MATDRARRYGYTNATRMAGGRVIKRYLGKDAAERMRAEVDAIRRTAGRVPLPTVVQVEEAERVVTFHRLPGRHGQELIDEGHGDRVLEAAGRTLRSLHAGSQSPTWTHGDYGPQNLLYDEATLEVTGVLDWEFAQPGDPIDDLAWAEWIVRMHHPGAASSLGRLFQGWGDEPAWDRRRAAMLTACHRFRDRAERLGDRPSAALWAGRAGITADWTA
jgi:aminoglycoside phosphotransferase (APT) family kinase protein